MLNAGQVEAKAKILDFINSKVGKFFVLNAPAGFGKSYLLENIEKEVSLPFVKCATTNKAARLINGVTVHKAFGFRVYNNTITGKVDTVTSKNTKTISNSVICIDESSMLSGYMLDLIDDWSKGSKVILIGDECQLAPVGEKNIPAFNSGYPSATLTEPMRQSQNSDLYKLCHKMRTGVEMTQSMSMFNGVNVALVSDMSEYLRLLSDSMNQDRQETKVITYTNRQAIRYNEFVREALNLPINFVGNDIVISRNFSKSVCGDSLIGVEDCLQIRSFGREGTYLEIPYIEVRLDVYTGRGQVDTSHVFRMPKSIDTWKAAIDKTQNDKNWQRFFILKESFVDLRAGYGLTSHSAQGSTYDTVFVDLADIESCKSMDMKVRMIYVAISRAKYKVVVLDPKSYVSEENS